VLDSLLRNVRYCGKTHKIGYYRSDKQDAQIRIWHVAIIWRFLFGAHLEGLEGVLVESTGFLWNYRTFSEDIPLSMNLIDCSGVITTQRQR
jgi:hypothetical protein